MRKKERKEEKRGKWPVLLSRIGVTNYVTINRDRNKLIQKLKKDNKLINES